MSVAARADLKLNMLSGVLKPSKLNSHLLNTVCAVGMSGQKSCCTIAVCD